MTKRGRPPYYEDTTRVTLWTREVPRRKDYSVTDSETPAGEVALYQWPDPPEVGHDTAGRNARDRQARDIQIGCDDSCSAEQAQASRNGRVQGDGHEGSPTEQDRSVSVAVVRRFLAEHGIAILFDNTMADKNAPRMAFSREELDNWLTALPEIDAEWLVDEVMLEVRQRGMDLGVGDIKRAVRKVVREDRRERSNQVIRPLLEGLLAPEHAAHAEREWVRLVSGVLEEDVEFGIAVLKHFIWQVLQKQLGRPVSHHLMPIIFSPIQGSGKTTFVLKFLGPLKELATGPVLLSEFTDPRGGDIYRFPVLFVDDVDRVDPRRTPVLKAIATGEFLQRRKLGTSMTVKHRQQSTLIGTSNEPITTLIRDHTGHRRFIALRFRNGAAEKGGDPEVWSTVDSADYQLLWRSVDAFGPSPIEAHLEVLAANQGESRPIDPLPEWLFQLDPMSPEVLRISERPGVTAHGLYDLFTAQTGSTMSQALFGRIMNFHLRNPASPFEPKIRKSGGVFYPVRPRKPTSE